MNISSLFTAPRKFDIVECIDCSVTIQWIGDVQNEGLSYELNHRHQGTDDWSVRPFSAEDALTGENGRRMFKVLNLQPEKYYEFRLRSVIDNVKSHYSETKGMNTLKLGNTIFEFTFPVE